MPRNRNAIAGWGVLDVIGLHGVFHAELRVEVERLAGGGLIERGICFAREIRRGLGYERVGLDDAVGKAPADHEAHGVAHELGRRVDAEEALDRVPRVPCQAEDGVLDGAARVHQPVLDALDDVPA